MICRNSWLLAAFLFFFSGFEDRLYAAPFEFPVKITQFPEGRIFFPIEDKKPSIDGSVLWNYKPTRWGMYDLLLVSTTNGTRLGDIEVTLGRQKLTLRDATPDMGDKWGMVTVSRVYLATADPFELRVVSSTPAALANLKGAFMRPAFEGKPIKQELEGITLHARDAVTFGVMMRYEPATNKNCLGYWTNPDDTALWVFNVTRPGSYAIELWQGCGKGQGGSVVSVKMDGPSASGRLVGIFESRFVVEDTGHFQNFIPREIGQAIFALPGEYSLSVDPLNKKAAAVMDIRQIVLKPVAPGVAPKNPALQSILANQRVIFLGDSITYAGEYIEYLETWLRRRYPTNKIDFINLGLPSETVSGLSEPGHAGGQFPRPDLHERLDRVLEKAKPDVIFACYGMNDGIYHPYSEERAASFQRGITGLRAAAKRVGAYIIHLTPPTFDPLPIKDRTLPAGRNEYPQPYEGYNDVLDRYSDWLVGQRANGWEVIDIHTAMNQFITENRKTDPKFFLAGDGVHVNSFGHKIMSDAIIRYMSGPDTSLQFSKEGNEVYTSPTGTPNAEDLKVVQQRQQVLRDAWLTYVGHKRPGMNKGKPLDEAQQEAAEIGKKLRPQ